ncbi:endo-alpha-N-acetylgalactosaminidase family protein [Paenibacillus sp. LHD-117]|uniref:endo-alpha-N-acetylgalactosaminidase family protein n=1 Tax=Paenibacillus sp. LHD-117 TaxID=3071412 RepID=UPI0027DFE73B|nr:endo-alpha-N-acetylgalactosaminidase family protein [Paenibacillus sp. LHD-117]MDQ6423481.1 endo-alpha-N-acetylgalactosaminidase family protein [Paenibacillus sp. LHD-117]
MTPAQSPYRIVFGTGQGVQEDPDHAFRLFANGSDTGAVATVFEAMSDGEFSFTMTPLGLAGKVGAVIRYSAQDSWIFVGCDTPMDPFGRSTWIWSMPCGKQGVLFRSDPLYEGHSYRMKLRFQSTVLTVYLNGYQVYHGELPDWKTGPGAVGFRAFADGNGGSGHARFGDAVASVLDDIYRSDFVAPSDDEPLQTFTLSSAYMDVEVDAAFPRVLRYRWKASGALLFGQEERLACVELNGKRYKPIVASAASRGNEASYRLHFPQLQAEMTVAIIVEGAALELRISTVRESGEFRIRTIEFPYHGLVSVRDTQEGAAFACAEGIKGDTFGSVSGEPATRAPLYRAIAIVHTAQLAASVIGNSLHNRRRLCVQTSQHDGYKQTSVWNAYWTYRGPDMEIIGEPWSKVIVTDDRNGDGIVDWQDGAMAVREALPPLPGAEALRRSYAHIAMNFASLAQFPFLRILDNVKKFFLYTDGFGQMLELKGYQSEGHDSGHPDYGGNFNERAGGLNDLNLLAERSLGLGAVIGVHINHSEAYPEARAYDNSLVTTTPGWRWLDQSYYIDREADIRSGAFDRRLDELKEQAPHLGFVYVDTYRDEHWAAWRLAEKLRGNGWTIWTEEADALDSDAVWTHDSTGDSRISRFIRHQDKDAYIEDKLLKGGYERYGGNGFMGWQRERDIVAAVRSFFTKQLPYRYLMHFAIMKWKDSEEAVLEGGVSSRLEHGVAVLRKNGRTIAIGDTVFIPWDPFAESKIYHWNAAGGVTAWQLPDGWPKSGTVKLYRLTNQGRRFDRDLEVRSGIVAIAAEVCVPYVLYPEEAPPVPVMDWGEGSPAKDPGFDSHGFDIWSRFSSAGQTDHIAIAETDYGQSYLRICGNGGADGGVSQSLRGLESGKAYSASVWVEVSEGREAAIRVSGYGGSELSRSIRRTAVKNCDVDSDKCGTYYQRLQIRFVVPGSESGTENLEAKAPVLTLFAAQGEADSYVHFDDVRVRETEMAAETVHLVYEDFEHVDEGWGLFVSANPRVGKTHLSQLHEGYTADTIEGQWSLKTMDELAGELIRTLPSGLSLQPNSKYSLSFVYKSENEGQYAAVLRTTDGGPQHDTFFEPLRAGLHEWKAEATTGPYTDYYFAIVRNDAERGWLVFDRFAFDAIAG